MLAGKLVYGLRAADQQPGGLTLQKQQLISPLPLQTRCPILEKENSVNRNERATIAFTRRLETERMDLVRERPWEQGRLLLPKYPRPDSQVSSLDILSVRSGEASLLRHIHWRNVFNITARVRLVLTRAYLLLPLHHTLLSHFIQCKQNETSIYIHNTVLAFYISHCLSSSLLTATTASAAQMTLSMTFSFLFSPQILNYCKNKKKTII